MSPREEPSDPFVSRELFDARLERGEMLWTALLTQESSLDAVIAVGTLSHEDLRDVVLSLLAEARPDGLDVPRRNGDD